MASTTRASEHGSHCEVQQGGSELISKTSLGIEFIGTIWNLEHTVLFALGHIRPMILNDFKA